MNITDEEDLPELSLSVDPSSIAEEDDDGTTGTAENVSTVTVEITNGKTFAVDQTVRLTFSGTATQGIHYSVSPGDAATNTAGHQVVLVKETASVEVTVTATTNSTADGPRTVTVAADLDGTAIGSRGITIRDDDTTTPALVSNTGQDVASTNWTVGGGPNFVHAQRFTTGDDADGYTLFSVQVYFRSGFDSGDAVKVSIYGADESDNPNSSLHELTNPSSIVNLALNTFTAPTRPTLEKETDYFIVVEAPAGSFFVGSTISDAEDGGAASGWSINDDRRRSDSGVWSSISDPLSIAVMGTIGAPTPVSIEAQYESIGAGLEDLLFTLTREGETTDELGVTVTITQEQSWLSDLDFTVTFTAGSATATLPIGASNFSFTPSTTGDLTARVSGDGIDGGSKTVKIISTSGPPITISFEESEYTFAENATDAAIYVLATLDAAYPRGYGPSRVLSVSFSSRTGTAESPEDYAAISWNAILFGSDFARAADTDPLVAREAVPDFAIVNDDIYEGSESFVMNIEEAPGLTAGLTRFADPDGTTCAGSSCVAEYTVNITDAGDLPVVSLSVDPSSIAEEDDDGTTGVSENVSTVTVEITNGKTFAGDVTVTLTFSGTATQGTHYSVSPGDADTNTPGHQVVLRTGDSSVEVTVTATGNDTADGPRTVTVAADLDGTAIGSSKDITILDDETTTTDTPVTIEVEHASIGAGLEDLVFTLTREGETTDELDVKVTIDQGQTWLSNLEYTVTFPANSATAELTITASNFSFTPSTTGDFTATVTGYDIDGGSDTVEIDLDLGTADHDRLRHARLHRRGERQRTRAVYLVATHDATYPQEPSCVTIS